MYVQDASDQTRLTVPSNDAKRNPLKFSGFFAYDLTQFAKQIVGRSNARLLCKGEPKVKTEQQEATAKPNPICELFYFFIRLMPQMTKTAPSRRIHALGGRKKAKTVITPNTIRMNPISFASLS